MGYFLEKDGMPVDAEVSLAWTGNEYFVKDPKTGELRPVENMMEWQRRLTDAD